MIHWVQRIFYQQCWRLNYFPPCMYGSATQYSCRSLVRILIWRNYLPSDGGTTEGFAHAFLSKLLLRKKSAIHFHGVFFYIHFKFKRHRPNLMTLFKLAATSFMQYWIMVGDSKKSLVMRLYFRKEHYIRVYSIVLLFSTLYPKSWAFLFCKTSLLANRNESHRDFSKFTLWIT